MGAGLQLSRSATLKAPRTEGGGAVAERTGASVAGPGQRRGGARPGRGGGAAVAPKSEHGAGAAAEQGALCLQAARLAAPGVSGLGSERDRRGGPGRRAGQRDAPHARRGFGL